MNRRICHSSIGAAALITVLFLGPAQASGQNAAAPKGKAKPESSGPNPHMADGHPDFNGVWTGGRAAGGEGDDSDSGGGDVNVSLATRTPLSGEISPIIFNRDNTILRRRDPNRPFYKPQYWEKVQYNDQNGNNEDPSYGCLPLGVPRMGPPHKIMQTATEMVFFYQGPDIYRTIPMDGRPRTPENDIEGTWMGESRGHWDGDTLVIETMGFNDTSWLDIAGYFHSENMKVTERMHRDGDKLNWQATVEDPDVLIKPWVMNPRTVQLNADPKAVIPESLPCIELDQSHLVTKEHH
jgi:hypothetical protein